MRWPLQRVEVLVTVLEVVAVAVAATAVARVALLLYQPLLRPHQPHCPLRSHPPTARLTPAAATAAAAYLQPPVLARKRTRPSDERWLRAAALATYSQLQHRYHHHHQHRLLLLHPLPLPLLATAADRPAGTAGTMQAVTHHALPLEAVAVAVAVVAVAG